LSKSFREGLHLTDKKVDGDKVKFTFQVNRKINKYPHKYGFYIITNGQDLDKLQRCIDSINDQAYSEKIITLIGPEKIKEEESLKKYRDLRFIPDNEIYTQDIRFPISKKKNLALRDNTSKVKIILHERITFSKDWLGNIENNNPYFDIYTSVLRNENGDRYLDKFGLLYSGYIYNNKRHYFLRYKESNENQYVDGGLFVLNSTSIGDCIFDENLCWGEMEDVDFVEKLKRHCCLISFDSRNTAYSLNGSHFALNESSMIETIYKVFLKRSSLIVRLKLFLSYWVRGSRN
tara:strand:- start:59 stop:928 length:870 start_codon:yes stop_codon:yes gene_type:complete